MNASTTQQTPPSGGSNLGPPPGPPPAAPSLTVVQIDIALFGYPLLYLLALIGHTSSLLIFSRPTLRCISTSLLFIALTISDSVYLLVSIYDFINVGLQMRDKSINPSAMCRFRSYIQWTAMCSNAWLLVTIATDRWIRIKFPFKSKQICTLRNALISIIIIIILSAGFNAHILQPDYNQVPAGIMTVCGTKPTNVVYDRFFRDIWPALFSCFQTLVPVVLLLILSIDTFRRLSRQTAIQNTQQARRRTQRDNQILIMMLATIILFIATTLPYGLFNILLTPVLVGPVGPLNQVRALQLQSIVTFIVAINYSLNFYIHCLTSRLFREQLLHIIKCQVRNNRIETITQTVRIIRTAFRVTQNQIQ